MKKINEEPTKEAAIARIMRLAVNCSDKHWDAACGDDPVTITADEAFALFLLVRFAGSHPTFVVEETGPQKLCMASAAVAFVGICLEGRCPDCGREFDSETGHNDEGEPCNNHCNQYPYPDTIEDIPHPPKKECH